MKTSFNQWAAGIIAVICIGILTAMHFHAGVQITNDLSPDAIKGILGLCGFYLFGSTAGSQAKDNAVKEQHELLINALQNSSPIITPPVQTNNTNQPAVTTAQPQNPVANGNNPN